MLNQYAVDYSHVPSQPASTPTSSVILAECSAVLWECQAANDKQPEHLGYAWYVGKRFCKSTDASSSAPHPQDLNPWSSTDIRTESLIHDGEE